MSYIQEDRLENAESTTGAEDFSSVETARLEWRSFPVAGNHLQHRQPHLEAPLNGFLLLDSAHLLLTPVPLLLLARFLLKAQVFPFSF